MSVVKDLKKFQTYWWENYFKNETNLNGMNFTNYRFFNWFTLLLSNTKHRFQINKWENSPSLLLLIVIVIIVLVFFIFFLIFIIIFIFIIF